MSTLYIFYKKNKTNERAIIYANSYLEAKETLFALNNYADIVYDLNEYRYQHVDTEKLYAELHLDDNYEGYPYILTEENYKNLENYIKDKQFSCMHNTHILTKKLANELSGEESSNKYVKYPLYSLTEFKNLLWTASDNNKNKKKAISDMIDHIGDIWYTTLEKKLRVGPENYVYGKSRKEVLDTLIKMDERYKDERPEIKLLIVSYPNYTEDDINRYDKFVSYIKDHKIKKLPIITNY